MIDEFLAELDRRLHLPRRARVRVLEEVGEHLEDAVTAHRAAGPDVSSAAAQAVHAFGAPGDLAAQLNAQSATATMRRTPIVLAACGAAVAGGFLLAATRNRPTAPTAVPDVVRVSFFVATIGAQVALVAGARAASLVAARWRNPIAPASERALVRASAVIGVGALATAAVGWSVAVLFAFDRGHPSRPATVIAGTLVMIGAAIFALATVARRSATDDIDPPLPASRDRGPKLLTVGERAVEQIRRHPALACTATATAGAVAAMSHAETTVSVALIWGAIEAAAVVAGFILLGSRLGLHPTDRHPTSP